MAIRYNTILDEGNQFTRRGFNFVVGGDLAAKEVTPQHQQWNPVGILPGMTVQAVLKSDVCR